MFGQLKNFGEVNANAFALTFAFATSHEGNASKVKRECKPSHTTVQTLVQNPTDTALNVNLFYENACKLDTKTQRTDRRATDNMGLAKAGGQWLIEQLCFLFTLVLGDS